VASGFDNQCGTSWPFSLIAWCQWPYGRQVSRLEPLGPAALKRAPRPLAPSRYTATNADPASIGQPVVSDPLIKHTLTIRGSANTFDWQVRVHHTTSCDLYLRAGSRPIIEACAGLRFAPLTDADLANLRLQGALTAAARLGEGDGGGDAGQELWRAVDDFGWVKATQSPNWAVLPEGERAAAPVPPPARTLDECAADNVLISPAAAAAVAAAVVAGGTVAAAKGAHE
jgi:hypothetical protein